MADILIVDDERDIRELISDILVDEGYATRKAGSSDDAMAELAKDMPGLLILDIWLKDSDMDGIDILKHVKKTTPELPVVIISGHGNIEIAVAAIKQGAYDFIEKPFNIDQLLVVIRRAMETSKLRRENIALKRRDNQVAEIIGEGAVSRMMMANLEKVTRSNGRVLLSGPSGSGKEVAARFIHANSNRSDRPFITLNSASLEPETMEEELFGRENGERGIEPGILEEANGGILFLDEIADLPLGTQSKLLRVLVDQKFHRVGGTEKQQVDLRIISSTSRDLTEEIELGRFREELYHRLNVVPISIPSLEERREDIPVLTEYFLSQLHEDQGLPNRGMSDDAMATLQTMSWPGNIRQLKNVLERVLILGQGIDPIDVDDLPSNDVRSESMDGRIVLSGSLATLPLREARELFEREYLLTQINRFGGNISRTASFVGMERSALHRKLKSLGVATSNRTTGAKPDMGFDS